METETLEKKLSEVCDMLINLEILKNDIKFISNKETEYFKEVVKESQFFYRTYTNSIKLFVIDICKLLNPNEDFSLIKILNYISSNRKRIKWKRELTVENINELKSRVEILISKEFKNFKDLRNKHYAHNDKNKFDLKYNFTLNKACESLAIIQEVFIEIYLKLSNTQYIFSLLQKGPSEIIEIYKYRQIKEYMFSELRKSPNIGKLQVIRDITISKGKI